MDKYDLLYLPIVLCFIVPIVRYCIAIRREEREERRIIAAHKAAARIEAERVRAEAERAEKEAAVMIASAPKRKRGRPRKTVDPETIVHAHIDNTLDDAASQEEPAPVSSPHSEDVARNNVEAFVPPCGNNAFVGETVAFTGTLPGMTRSEAIKAVRENGGKAFESMTSATTILVVGDRPGARKIEDASRWPACKQITATHFFVLLHQPLTYELEAFEAVFRAWIMDQEKNNDTTPAMVGA